MHLAEVAPGLQRGRHRGEAALHLAELARRLQSWWHRSEAALRLAGLPPWLLSCCWLSRVSLKSGSHRVSRPLLEQAAVSHYSESVSLSPHF